MIKGIEGDFNLITCWWRKDKCQCQQQQTRSSNRGISNHEL